MQLFPECTAFSLWDGRGVVKEGGEVGGVPYQVVLPSRRPWIVAFFPSPMLLADGMRQSAMTLLGVLSGVQYQYAKGLS